MRLVFQVVQEVLGVEVLGEKLVVEMGQQGEGIVTDTGLVKEVLAGKTEVLSSEFEVSVSEVLD
jgi:hypothetical protein